MKQWLPLLFALIVEQPTISSLQQETLLFFPYKRVQPYTQNDLWVNPWTDTVYVFTGKEWVTFESLAFGK